MNDQRVIFAVVTILGLIALSVVVGGIVLAIDAKTGSLPDALIALGSSAAGSVATLLARASTDQPSPSRSGESGQIDLSQVLVLFVLVLLVLVLLRVLGAI